MNIICRSHRVGCGRFDLIYFIFAEDDEYSVRGEVEGYIGDKPLGKNGFGYDPIFMLDEDESMATISADEKNKISHRADAFRKLSDILKEKFDAKQ